MKKHLLTIFMVSAMAVSVIGCGGKAEETLEETEAITIPAEIESETESMTEEELTAEPESSTEATKEETKAGEENESTAAETTEALITEKEAKALLLEAFGSVDESTGEKNIFTYEEVVTVDGTDYYSYKWEGEDGTYYCNAFVKTNGSDVITGIYSNGKWELGSDAGSGVNADHDEDVDEEYFEDDEPYDDGFGDIDPDYEEEAEDEFEFEDENGFEEY